MAMGFRERAIERWLVCGFGISLHFSLMLVICLNFGSVINTLRLSTIDFLS
jgi:hypothetical protein